MAKLVTGRSQPPNVEGYTYGWGSVHKPVKNELGEIKHFERMTNSSDTDVAKHYLYFLEWQFKMTDWNSTGQHLPEIIKKEKAFL